MLTGAVDPHQLIFEFVNGRNGYMDSVGLAREVRIEGADNDSGMRRDALTVKADEVLPVQRQKNSTFGRCEDKNLRVGNSLCWPSPLREKSTHSDRVSGVPEPPGAGRFHSNRCEPSGRFVVPNLGLNLSMMSTHKSPGVRQVLRAQRRIGVQ